MFAITDREAQIEALWTYEVSTEKVLRRAVKKGFITQEEADGFSERLLNSLIRIISLVFASLILARKCGWRTSA